jgi:hypothetical protein
MFKILGVHFKFPYLWRFGIRTSDLWSVHFEREKLQLWTLRGYSCFNKTMLKHVLSLSEVNAFCIHVFNYRLAGLPVQCSVNIHTPPASAIDTTRNLDAAFTCSLANISFIVLSQLSCFLVNEAYATDISIYVCLRVSVSPIFTFKTSTRDDVTGDWRKLA